MPDGMDSIPQDTPLDSASSFAKTSDDRRGKPLDGVQPPPSAEGGGPAHRATANRRKLLLIVLGGAGAFFLFYLSFAVYLMAVLPDPTGGGLGLTFAGNLFYGAVCVLSVALLLLLALRALRMGLEPAGLPRVLLRPALAALVILGIAGMVFATINRQVPLPIDVVEPQNLRGLTAPTTVTFGTHSLRSILRKQGFIPRKYKWDFNGDGTDDAETEEHEVTTVYQRKGTYRVRLKILFSDNSVRTAFLPMSIPDAVFAVAPVAPIVNEEVAFDAQDLVADPEAVEKVLWDFNGDAETDLESEEMTALHTFTEAGTYQVRATIQHRGGLQEVSTRPVTVLRERRQPFAIAIETEGPLRGPAPFGVIFRAVMEEGVNVRAVRWRFRNAQSPVRGNAGETAEGERVSHVFTDPGDYRAVLTVTDTQGRTAEREAAVSVLEPLKIADIVISGSPRPVGGRIEGKAPLTVQLEAVTRTPFITFRWEQEHASRVFSTEGQYHATYEEPGTFPVVLIAEDADGRMQKTELEISVQPPSSRVAFTAIPSTGIAPLQVSFDASQSFVPDGRITGFSWTFGDAGRNEQPRLLGAKAKHTYSEEGTFAVIVRALTEDGRSFEARKTIVVRQPTLDACAFPSRTSGDAPMGVRFDASCSTGNIARYVWDFGDGATSFAAEPLQDHVFEKPGTYTVKLDVEDEQGNSDETSITVTAR